MTRLAAIPLLALAALLAAGSQPISPDAAPAVETVAHGLQVPWALAFAPDGRLFVTERPGRLRVVRGGQLESEPLATLPVAAAGEGGLMGLVLDPDFARTSALFLCYTASGPSGLVNRIVRLTLRDGKAGETRVLVDGIPAGRIHDGCRLALGPDGKLYATTGDAGEPALAQRPDSLAGKLLRLELDGGIPADNPFRGSPVYSLGHRNPQGLDWDAARRLFAAEHGPSGHDEVNLIEAGRNYGWPVVVGAGGNPAYVDPLVESGDSTWAPSGLAVLGDQVFVAALRGRRLLRFTVGADRRLRPDAPLLDGTHGRLRAVVVGPDGALYVTTSNRDGRGSPAPDDDRILRVRL